jgi:hypothetical protein
MATYSNPYPGSATMQFMALGSTATHGLYVAAHDTQANLKQLSFDASSSFSIQTTPPGATLPIVDATFSAAYPVVFASLPPSSPLAPLWSSASAIYADFVHSSEAPWLSAGPIAQRLSKDLLATNLWINSGWQCHDIFEDLQGDPAVVNDRVSTLLELWESYGLTTPVALHWYEWQQGPSADPDDRYKFDTHYPDYFPARVSEDSSTVAGVAESLYSKHRVSSYPYINGRIFDTTSVSYLSDDFDTDGSEICVKSLKAPKLFDNSSDVAANLDLSIESYGSGPSFCVANPFTPYWQQKVAETVTTLGDDYGMPGVYIDQIAAAAMDVCFDSTHGHELGNGGWWRTGYKALIDELHANAKSDVPMIVTEANAEVYMDMVEGFLVLTAYVMSLSSAGDAAYMVPAFSHIYGGYYNAFGAEFYANDFKDKTWFRAKLANQWVRGAQLGWMSLGGIEDDSCGDMGVFDLLMDPENEDLNRWIVSLSEERAYWTEFLVEGREVPGAVVQGNFAKGRKQSDESKGAGCGVFSYDEVAVGVWEQAASNSHAVVMANVYGAPVDGVTVTVSWSSLGYSVGDVVSVEMRGERGFVLWKKSVEVVGGHDEWESEPLLLQPGISGLVVAAAI